MSNQNLARLVQLEHGHIGSRTLLVKHSGTRVERHALEAGARSPNFINAIGDRPKRETSGDLERQTLNSGGTRTTDSITHMRTTERSEGVSK